MDRCLRRNRGCIFLLLILAALPAHALNRGALVKELQLPRMSFNFDIAFSTSELKVPVSSDPAAEIQRLEGELKANDDPGLRLRMAVLLREVGRLEEAAVYYRVAVDGYQKALEAEPRNAAAHQGLAEALLSLGDDTEAAKHLEEALVLDEGQWKVHELSADLHAKHAVIAYEQGMRELMRLHLQAAEEEAREAARLAPTEPGPLTVLFTAKWIPAVLELQVDPMAGLANLGRFEELSGILARAAQLAPGFPRLKQHAVTCKLIPFFAAQLQRGLDKRIGQQLTEHQLRVLTTSRDELLAVAAEVPALRADALLFAGLACFMLNDDKAMFEHLRASADAASQATPALEAMVGFLTYKQDWPQALKVAQEMVQRQASGKAYCWIGRIRAEQGQWKPAEEAFREALKFQDAPGPANLGLGVVLLKSGGDAATAASHLRQALEAMGPQPEVLMALGVALALVGQVGEGAQYVRQALEDYPGTPGLDRVAKELGIKGP